ncbi:tetratricopeptide repeat protein [Modestobacter excelsi]|uniref:tetratricopeptide repeat protein n=1 Tax=Modestobacter excelsi TaxID=2213161 RepID=UPI00110D0C43|nr:tetratricopeptide repeat protein [Modestobacter excelsi]
MNQPDHGDDGTDGPTELRRQLERAWRSIRDGHAEESAQAFEYAVNLDPGSDEAWTGLGRAMSQLGRYEAAARTFDRALEINPENAEALLFQSVSLMQMGRLDEAANRLHRAASAGSFDFRDLAHALGRPRESSSEPEGDVDFSSHAARLRLARDRGLRAIEATEFGSADKVWREFLLPAAQQLLETLGSIANDEALWASLVENTIRSSAQRATQLREVFNQDLSALLVYMGYRPPPPPQALELELIQSLSDALEAGEKPSASRLRRVQYHLALFSYRLRRVITEAEIEAREREGRVQDLSSWHRLRSAVGKGAKIAAPAAFATGVMALVFPPGTGAAAAVGFGAATNAAGQELLKQGTQIASTGLLDRWLADEPTLAPVAQKWPAAQRRALRAMGDLRSLLSSDRPDTLWAKSLKAFSVECVSALCELAQVDSVSPQRSHHDLPITVNRGLALVNDIRDLPATVRNLESTHAFAQQLLFLERSLSDIPCPIG